MKKFKLKKIPYFKSEKEEREFWQTHDSTEYVDWSKARRVRFPNLRLTSRPITIRLPDGLIEQLKLKAHQRDIPYQTYIKLLLYDSLENSHNNSKITYPVRSYSQAEIKKFLAYDKKLGDETRNPNQKKLSAGKTEAPYRKR